MGYFQVPDSEAPAARENASKQNLVSTISPSEALADPDPARRLGILRSGAVIIWNEVSAHVFNVRLCVLTENAPFGHVGAFNFRTEHSSKIGQFFRQRPYSIATLTCWVAAFSAHHLPIGN